MGDTATKTLPPGWQIVLFEQMAECVTDRAQPADADTDYYVGLEHLDPESLKIRRWGSPNDVIGTKLRFKPGDIIFGKRRFYQRKLAVAEREGICSAHAMVLRAREETVLPEFLPFFMQGDIFFERAMSISIGSLSPTINWKTLARQEFAIPPKDEQRRLAGILRQVDLTIIAWEVTLESIKSVRLAVLTETFNIKNIQNSPSKTRWELKLLKDCATVQTGLAKGKKYTNEATIELPYLRVANVQDGYLDLTEIKKVKVAVKDVERYLLEVGDVLLTEGGDFDKLGRGTIWQGEVEKCLHQNHVFVVRPKRNNLISKFLSYQTGSQYGKQYFLSCSKQTTNLASINASQVNKFPVIIPPLSEQELIVERINTLELRIKAINMYVLQLKALKKTFLTQILTLK